MGCLVMEGGGSQVDQETRTVHRGYPLFGVVQPPPFSEWGYVPRVFSAPASSRKSWGCLTGTFHYSASRIPYGPS